MLRLLASLDVTPAQTDQHKDTKDTKMGRS
jgi:hypothetical protein